MTDRNELERLLEAATEGPWVVRTIDESIGGIDTACGEFSVAQASIVDRRQPGIRNLTDALSRRQANAALIVWLRNNAQHYLSLMDEVEQKNRQIASLFDAIKHGDQEHQNWLRDAITKHFAGETHDR